MIDIELKWRPSNLSNFPQSLYLCFISPAIPSPQKRIVYSAGFYHISSGSNKMPASIGCIKESAIGGGETTRKDVAETNQDEAQHSLSS